MNMFCLSFQVKVQGQNEDMLAAACQQFLGMELDQIDHVAQV